MKASRVRNAVIAVSAGACLAAIGIATSVHAADTTPPAAVATFQKYCVQCHGKNLTTAGINLDQLTSHGSPGESFQQWERVIAALDQNKMPPKGLPQPTDEERHQAVSWIHSELDSYIRKHAGDPGRVTVRRLTSGEYAYTIQDLTGLSLDLGIDASSDSVGGEGFSNFGDVQFMQDANLERYLAAAKFVADHAMIGAGPVEFFADPGKTGFELYAITRIKDIYAQNGFRTVSGEGGKPFGLEKYGKAFYAAWRYKHRVALGEPMVTLKDLAVREGVSVRFVQHIWNVCNLPSLSYPSSDVVAKWRKMPAPTADSKATETAARSASLEVQNTLTGWPAWFFARGDAAAGGQGDEDPLVFRDVSLKAEPTHQFRFNRQGGRGPGAGRGPAPTGPATIYLNLDALNQHSAGKPGVIWRNAMIAYRKPGPGRGAAPPVPVAGDGAVVTPVQRGLGPAEPPVPLRQLVSEETAKKLGFGVSPDGGTIGPNDFVTDKTTFFEVPVPAGMSGFELQIEATLGSDKNQVYRLLISDRDGANPRGGKLNRFVLGDPQSAGYKAFKAGVMEYATILPPNSNAEPTPADKDPAPEPFDPTFNVPEHDDYIDKVKYIRDDKFVIEHILDDATRARLNHAWSDLFTSFEYHNTFAALLAEHYKIDVKGKRLSEMTKAEIEALPAESRTQFRALKAEYDAAVAAEQAAKAVHVEDSLKFASRAWRRPLTEKEKLGLRAFYDKTMASDPDHRAAIRALITRILVAPQFLYRVEQPAQSAASAVGHMTVRPVADVSNGIAPAAKALSNWELASRLSYFLWSSIPDEELRRAAAAGELTNPQELQRQAKRMLTDPKARRLSTEFFGQWLGFYHFDQFKGVDTSRFTDFTQDVKEGMYDEAVSFFEYVIRQDRPVHELLDANYDFLNKPLAKYYGVKQDIKSTGPAERVENANTFERGGILRLGAVLTATSAPLRTSPVKRGDWVLRRIIGTPVPPPPADAGSIPADDKLFGGLSVKERLQAHKRNATCANCHTRIDPLGFALEHYDSTGRWRDKYSDDKPIDDTGTLSDKTEIAGVKGLLGYLQSKDSQVRKTLSWKLLGYAFGRTVMASDMPLIEQMSAHGPDTKFSELITTIVTSEQFRNHLTKEDSGKPAPIKIAANLIPSDKAGRQ